MKRIEAQITVEDSESDYSVTFQSLEDGTVALIIIDANGEDGGLHHGSGLDGHWL